MALKIIQYENQKMPKLRFPGFSQAWVEKEFKNFLIPISREVPKPLEPYKAIRIRSHFKGTFQKLDSDPEKIEMEKLFVVEENDFILNITFAWEGALAIAKKEDQGGLVSHRFPTYIFNKNIIDPNYFKHVFPNNKMKYILGIISPGGAGRNRVLNKKDFLKIKIILPSIPEQNKISAFLGILDSWIEILQKQKEYLQFYKEGISKKIFIQEIRFQDENGESYPKWEELKLGNCLDYIQPNDYIVSNTEYDNSYKIPVLTAGKTFILGYTNESEGIFKNDLPVIIFDDFTTASQFVDFPFKVKSSAIKILKAKDNIDIKFIYEAMKKIKTKIGVHGRHWISKYSNIKILVPSLPEQQKIADFLTSINKAIELKEQQVAFVEEWKKSLIQSLLI